MRSGSRLHHLIPLLALLALPTLLTGCPDETVAGDGDAGVVVVDRDDAGPGGCEENDDCPFGQLCVEGACVTDSVIPVDDGCTSDDECELGFVCATSTGICVVDPETPPPLVGPPGECVTGDVRSCGRKLGRCDYGVEECVAGAWSGVCEGGIGPRTETCDGTDDDCDGQTDEDFVVGAVCDEGLGVCNVEGRTICTPDGLSTQCDAVPLSAAGRSELCGNGDDDDCDGSVDEGFETLSDACGVGVGECARTGTFICAADLLSLRCSATPGVPAPADLCGNGLDDNCVGGVDEGFELLGTACTADVGGCQVPGTRQCSGDLLGLTCVPTASGGETCNGLDDDNDVCIDEDFDVGAACTSGLGICRTAGTKVCRADGTGTQCNAVPALPNPFGELCGNGLDDDCDGQTDEVSAFPTLGQACTVGLGVCAQQGAFVCAADGRGVVCDAVPGLPGAEQCGNGRDDDCDGDVDEGFDVGAACTSGLGICERSGTKICSADRLRTVCNATPGAPNVNGELCGNGLDDDCDGTPDEGFTLGVACTAGLGQCQASGTTVCSADRLSTTCNAPVGSPTPEACNNLDEDCNGEVDNGCDDDGDDYCDAALAFSGLPTVCPLSTSAALLDCNDANATINPGAAEICGDNRDQNCDGNNSDGCQACNPAIDADFDGSNQCNDCDDTNGAIRPGAVERCDGFDNNCDGRVDEGFDADGDTFTTCGSVPGGGVDRARIDCNDANRNVFPGACELCASGSPGNTVACGAPNDRGNGIDEDCDGFVDETCAPCDAVDRDGDGFSQCDGDCAPNDGAVRPGLAEVCDGKDTDCNRNTVDNCGVGEPCNFPTAQTDECEERLICVQSLSAGGRPTGTFTCTSFCNQTGTGAGLGDGCATGETCGASLTPTANLHGCALTSGTGAAPVGTTCRRDDECRSGLCFTDGRQTGNVKYCTDLCGNDDACGNGTTCQHWGGTARCMQELSLQTTNYLGACTTSTNIRCKDGTQLCMNVNGGNCGAGQTCRCSEICCTNSDCASGSYCSLDGTQSAGTNGGVDTVPSCSPTPSGNQGRPGGAACAANNECASNFCDRHTGVCMEVCCHDATCSPGLLCESVLVNLNPDADTTDCTAAGAADTDDRCTFSRMCIGITPAQAVEKR